MSNSADGRDKPKPRRGVQRSTFPDNFPSVRNKLPKWTVFLYLGDQCDWAIVGTVGALTEADAVAQARQVVALAWPTLYEAAHLDSTPVSAIPALHGGAHDHNR